MLDKFKKLIEKGDNAYVKYSSVCDRICIEAQKYINWGELRWEYTSSDGLCFGIIGEYYLDDMCDSVINDITLFPAESFFELVSLDENITPEVFYHNKI